MFLKINFNLLLIALHSTLLISYISADENESNLKKQFTNDLTDTNSDLKWWEYFIAASSNTKESKNILPAESVAFDVVQSHLSDDEIPDEEETPKVTSAPVKSIAGVKTSSKRPAVIQITTRQPITTTVSPIKTRPVAQPATKSKPAIQRPAVKAQTATGKSSISDEEELDDNTIVIKPSIKAPTKPAPSVKRPASQPTKTTTISGGVKGRQPAPSKQPRLTPTTIRVTTTTSSSLEESDEEEERVATTKKPIVQPKKPIIPIKTPQPSGVKGGTKTKQVSVKQRPATQRPIAVTTVKPITTTVRTIVTTEAEDDNEESLPTSKPAPRKVPIPQPKQTPRPISGGVKGGIKTVPQQVTRKVIIQTTTARAIVTTESDEDEEEQPRTTTRAPVSVITQRPAIIAKKPIGTKQPAKPSPGTKSVPSIRPITVTTPRPIVTTTTEESEEDETPSTSRPAVVAPQPARKLPQPQRPVQPVQPTKRPVQPQVTRKVQIQTTTRRPAPVTDEEDDDENEISVPRKAVPAPAPKRPSGTKLPPSRPQPSGVKIPQPSPGVKGRQPIVRATTQRPQTTTTRVVVTTESDSDDEENELPSAKPAPVAPRTQRPQIQTTTTSKPAIAEEDEDEESPNEIPAVPRKPVPAPRPSPQQGTKTRPQPIGTKTRPQPAVSRPTTEAPEEENEETEAPRKISVPSPRPRVIAKATTPSSEDEEEEERSTDAPTTRRPVPQPLPRGTKTRPAGTKTISTRPAPVAPRVTSAPVARTTTTSSIEEDNEEDEAPSTSRPSVPAPRRGVKTITPAPRIVNVPRTAAPITTPKSVVAEDDEDEEKIDLPAPKPAVQPARPSISGRKIVSRVSSRPAETTEATIVTTTATARRVISKTRVEKTMRVPRPVSFQKTNSQREQPIETTTLKPIPVPQFEPTRRSAVKPIIQSISDDNEEDSSESELPPKRSAAKNAERIYTSDLAKFSSRVKYAERQSDISTNRLRSSFSSYSPPLIEPIIEINRIK